MPYADPDKLRAYRKARYQANKERLLEVSQAWYSTHKEQQQVYHHEKYEKNKEKLKAQARARYHAKREQILEYKRQFWQDNKDSLRVKRSLQQSTAEARAEKQAYNRRYQKEHRATIKVQQHLHYLANREKQIADARARYAKDPLRHQAYRRARTARKHGAPRNDLTAAQWEAIKAAYGHRCAYCGRKMQRLTQDHITPLSQGGSHTLHNVIPACRSCNSKKHTGPPLCPVQPLLL